MSTAHEGRATTYAKSGKGAMLYKSGLSFVRYRENTAIVQR